MERMRQNKHFVTAVCLILGAVLLCSAAVANIGNAGGYEAYKKGLLGLLTMEQYSGSGYIELFADGQSVIRANYTEAYNSNTGVGEAMSHQRIECSSDLYSHFGSVDQHWAVKNPADHITKMPYTSYSFTEEDEEYPGGSWYIDSAYGTGALFHNMGEDINLNDEYTAKIMRVAELAVDIFVGNLKNNFIYMGSEDGLKNYRISLSGDQLPEIVQAVISLMFDDNNSALIYGTSYAQVVDAVGFNSEDVEWEDYQSARRSAWKMIENEHSNEGCGVINADLSVDWYPTVHDYLKSAGTLSLTDLINMSDMEMLFFALDGEPRIESAVCELSVDDKGRLMANTLSGKVEFKLVDGSWHEAELVIHGEFDSRDNVSIDLPQIDPAAHVIDRSIACEENDYEYTVTIDGVTTTYHNYVTAAETDSYSNIGFFAAQSPFERISSISPDVLDLYSENGLNEDGLEYYVVGPNEDCVLADEFNDMCESTFGNAEILQKNADIYGIPAELLLDELLDCYKAVTGTDYSGPIVTFGNNSISVDMYTDYLLNTAPIDRLMDAAECCGVSLGYVSSIDDIDDREWFEAYTHRDENGEYEKVYVNCDELLNAYTAIIALEDGVGIDDYSAIFGIEHDLDRAVELVEESYSRLCSDAKIVSAAD